MIDFITDLVNIIVWTIIVVGGTVIFCYVMDFIMILMGAPSDE